MTEPRVPESPTPAIEGDEPVIDLLQSTFDRIGRSDAPTADWADLSRRIESHHRRRQLGLAVGGALVAVLTGIGGYAVGHGNDLVSLRSDSVTRAVGSGESTASSTPGEDATAGPDPTSPARAVKRTVLSRRTPDGIDLRVWSAAATPPEIPGVLPPGCIRTEDLFVAGISDSELAQGPVFVPEDGTALASWSSGGYVDAPPGTLSLLTVVNVNARRVEVTFADGSTDSMAPVEGIAVFASTLDPESTGMAYTNVKVVSFSDDGTASDIKVVAYGEDVPLADCTPRLPQPGPQPADPTTARAGVVASLDKLFDQTLSLDDRLSVVDDPGGLKEAYEAVLASDPESIRHLGYHLVDLVFTSPGDAVVKYVVVGRISGVPDEVVIASSAGDFGAVHLVDGAWRITRATVCSILSDASGRCREHGPSTAGTEPTQIPPSEAVPRGPSSATDGSGRGT